MDNDIVLKTEDLTKHYGGVHALEGANFELKKGEHVAIMGDNGAGKSTTFKLITGELEADTGEIVRQDGLTVAQLAQELPESMDKSVRDVVRAGLAAELALVAEFHESSQAEPDRAGLARLEAPAIDFV